MKKLSPILILSLFFLIVGCVKDSNEHIIFKNGIKNPDGTYPDGVVPEGVYRDQTLKGYDNNKNSVPIEIKDNLIYKGNKLYTGILIQYFDNGDINFEGNITDGKKDGLMKGYYNNNQIGFETNYKNGIKHGRHTLYYENGNLLEEGNYIDGKEEGIWVTVDSLGYINKGNYNNGKREGIWNWYDVDPLTSLDTLKIGEQVFEEGILRGEMNFDEKDGETIERYINYYNSGQKKSEYSHINGKLNGKYISYHENGKVYLEEDYKDGKQVNKFNFFYENGQKSSENSYTYINEDQHSKWIKYYENGEIQEEGKYINGKENGEFILYKGGEIIERHHYRNGQLDGKSYIYYDNGQKESEVTYKDGELINTIGRWNKDGSPK